MPVRPPYDAARAAHLAACRRAVRRHSGDCVVSHASAAIVHGLPVYRIPAGVFLTRSAGSRRTGGATHVSVAALEALVVADGALRRRLDPDNLRAQLIAKPEWPGLAAARPVLTHADGRAESAAETVVRGRCVLLDLPVPEPQVWLEVDGGELYRVDLYWRACRLIGEVDGRLKYTSERVIWAEKERRDQLQERHAMIRWTWRQAHAPDEVFRERVLRAMDGAPSVRPARMITSVRNRQISASQALRPTFGVGLRSWACFQAVTAAWVIGP